MSDCRFGVSPVNYPDPVHTEMRQSLVLVNCLGSLPRNSADRFTDGLDMTVIMLTGL